MPSIKVVVTLPIWSDALPEIGLIRKAFQDRIQSDAGFPPKTEVDVYFPSAHGTDIEVETLGIRNDIDRMAAEKVRSEIEGVFRRGHEKSGRRSASA